MDLSSSKHHHRPDDAQHQRRAHAEHVGRSRGDQQDQRGTDEHDGHGKVAAGPRLAELRRTALPGEPLQSAHEAGTIVSYDLNYRKSLWQDIGGQEKAKQVNRAIAPYVDVMLGNEEDFTAALGFEVKEMDKGYSKLDPANFKKMITEVVKEFPNLKVVATTLRNAKTASVNDWGAVIYTKGEFYEATLRPDLEIYDRVGGGDSFASGLIYGLMEGKTPAEAVNYGAAHGALAMTTPGDTTTASLREVEKVMQGGGARVDR